MSKIILKANDLDGYLTESDKESIEKMRSYYEEAIKMYETISTSNFTDKIEASKKELINIYNRMGVLMQEITEEIPAIKVYSFETPRESHGEASRLIAKLRDVRTDNHEFLYYIQRAYEMLFNLAYGGASSEKNYLITKTPVNVPVQNYAVHKIPDVDAKIENSVMCVMLRGALLPSMIMSKEIQEYSSESYVTPFALFKISRDDSKQEKNMEYILDLEKSYFDLESLNGKDLIFCRPDERYRRKHGHHRQVSPG